MDIEEILLAAMVVLSCVASITLLRILWIECGRLNKK